MPFEMIAAERPHLQNFPNFRTYGFPIFGFFELPTIQIYDHKNMINLGFPKPPAFTELPTIKIYDQMNMKNLGFSELPTFTMSDDKIPIFRLSELPKFQISDHINSKKKLC